MNQKKTRMIIGIFTLSLWIVLCLGIFTVFFVKGLKTLNFYWWFLSISVFFFDWIVGDFLFVRIKDWMEKNE